MQTDTGLGLGALPAPRFLPVASIPAAPPPLPGPPANVLIVDDRPDKLLALEATLAPLGQNLVQATSGKEALRHLLKQDFAVILLDVSMPGMDGFETASLIRQRPSSEHTPIIFVTCIGNSDTHIARGYSLGAVDYILAPIIPEILRTKVSVFVELYKQTKLIKTQAEQLRLAEEARHRLELAQFADRLETETQRNRFFTLAPELLGLADFNGRLLQVNDSWERVLGYTEQEIKTVSGFDLVHPEDREKLLTGLEALRKGNPLGPFEGRFRHKNGSYRWLAGSAAPFAADKLIYIFVADITARKEAEQKVAVLNGELEQQVCALRAANQELEAFNYSIAHDLRTPLRSMSGFARALLEDESENLSAIGLEYARRISQAAKYMDTLLLDLLAYSRLTRAELKPVLVNLDEPVIELLSVVEKEIKDRMVRVDVQSPLGAAYAHLPTLKQIISNLISNSLKFTSPDRAPALKVFTTTDGKFLRLWVEDNGIGIPEQHHEKIFGLFQRLHDSQLYPGTGIGLALVRKGAERMGGRVGVESKTGEGSRFWVDLPAADDIANAA